MNLDSDNTPAIHHVTYEFSPVGLSEETVAFHVKDVKAVLSDLFGLSREMVHITPNKKAESIDVRVMVGGSQDYIRKIAATREVHPLFAELHKQPALMQARVDGYEQVMLTVVRPRQPAGVAHG